MNNKQDTKYQGWTNWNTWNANLHLTNWEWSWKQIKRFWKVDDLKAFWVEFFEGTEDINTDEINFDEIYQALTEE